MIRRHASSTWVWAERLRSNKAGATKSRRIKRTIIFFVAAAYGRLPIAQHLTQSLGSVLESIEISRSHWLVVQGAAISGIRYSLASHWTPWPHAPPTSLHISPPSPLPCSQHHIHIYISYRLFYPIPMPPCILYTCLPPTLFSLFWTIFHHLPATSTLPHNFISISIVYQGSPPHV